MQWSGSEVSLGYFSYSACVHFSVGLMESNVEAMQIVAAYGHEVLDLHTYLMTSSIMSQHRFTF